MRPPPSSNVGNPLVGNPLVGNPLVDGRGGRGAHADPLNG
jgi:hypothetical protein